MPFDLNKVRHQFPALQSGAVYLDNPGGTQVVKNCLDRILEYLIETNANLHGAFKTARESDVVLLQARTAVAEFLNAARTEEILFGQNMTSLTFQISRSLARTLGPGDDVIVTRLDHDANITPWTIAAEERGATVKWVDFHPETGTLDLDGLKAALAGKPKIVAVGYASNSLGTVNPVAEIVKLAHAAGALVFIDAVHYAPHGPVDVRGLGCDFLACSAYKFFGPHLGILYGRHDLLNGLFPYKVRPSSNVLPTRLEQGTMNHEALAGLLGTLEYYEALGKESFHKTPSPAVEGTFEGRTLLFKQVQTLIRDTEREMSRALLKVLRDVPGLTLYGPADESRLAERVPTFSFRLQGLTPRETAVRLDAEGIYVWDGNYYALEISRRLGVEDTGGMVRAGGVHYNSPEDIDRFAKALHKIAHGECVQIHGGHIGDR
jgi:cysteine desulfurase family protein (TIGR01976 family)